MALDEFTAAYIEAALWSSVDDDDDPLDSNYDFDDLAKSTLLVAIDDCHKFQEKAGKYLYPQFYVSSRQHSVPEMAGYDFWMTRNSHGVGFWDGDWADEAEKFLDELAKSFGEVYWYVGDDGKIYQTGAETFGDGNEDEN